MLPPFHALILGLVEGITEYLPVSSTGHLIVASKMLGIPKESADSFDIVIQLGAILAVLVHYRALLAERTRGLLVKDARAIRLLSCLGVAFVPAAGLGFFFGHWIKDHFFKPHFVAGAFAVGGVVMIVFPLVMRSRAKAEGAPKETTKLEDVTVAQAFKVGLGQVLALFPGASRSMCTILAGQIAGLSTPLAAEFSFLLGLPTLGAATVYEGLKARHVLMHDIGATSLVIGLVVSFVVAWIVIAAFIKFLSRFGLAPFGFYRIAAAVVVWVVLSP